MKSTRRYVMRARAQAAEDTRRRILAATLELFWEQLTPAITLDDVAARAAVSVPTVLRHFGSRDGLLDQVEPFAHEQALAERRAPAGDVAAAIHALVDHYEQRGDAVVRLLGQEVWDPRIRRVNDVGREVHRAWVLGAFAPWLGHGRPGIAGALADLLVVATDVGTWKLLRRDRGLAREQAEARILRLVRAVLAHGADEEP